MSLTQEGTNAEGNHESSTTELHPDGKEHPVSAEAPGVVMVTRWVTSHALDTLAKKDGEVIGYGTYEVSSDGSTLTAKVWGTDATGERFDQVIVCDGE